MKKALKITGIVLIVLIGLLIAIPYIFKDKIVEQIKLTTNENLNAKVDFSDVSLSFFSSFPNLGVTVKDFIIDGEQKFEGVQLANVKSIYANIDLSSLFGDSYAISEIEISDGKIDVRVLEDGTSNYDIAVAGTDTATVETSVEESAFKIEVQKYALNNIDFIYDDKSYPMRLELEDLDHSGKGDLAANQTVLNTITSVGKMNMDYDGITYVKNAKADMVAELDLDLKNSKYTFKENVITLNELKLQADGWMSMPEEDIDMDLTFSSIENNFKNLFSMVPASFATDLTGVDINGIMDVSGFVKGVYSETSMPEFGFDLNVDKGSVNYTALPKSIKSINIDANISGYGDVNLNDIVIDIPKFYMEIAENPIDVKLTLKNAMIDPELDCDVRAKVILDHLKDVVPLEKGDALEGSLIADLSMHGKMSSIENERYDEFEAVGNMIVQDILFKSDSLAFDMHIHAGYFNFTPRHLEVTQFKADIGQSDIQAQGKIDNYIAYLLKDEMLQGAFVLNSEKMNLNEFMSDEEVATTTTATGEVVPEPYAAIELPGNIDFDFGANFKNLTYGDIEMKDVTGNIRMKDKVAFMENVKMNVMQGIIIMDGSYDSRNIEEPKVDMVLDMKNIDIQESAEMFYTIDKMAPIAKSCRGKFSTKMNFKTSLDANMEPIASTIDGGGNLLTNSVTVEKFKPLNEIAAVLGIDKLSKQTIENVNLSYVIKNGKAIIKPFDIKLDGMKTTIEGSTGLMDQSIDYLVKMDVPYEKFPSKITSQADGLISKINSKLGTNLSVGDKIPLTLSLTGTIDNPKVGTNYGDVAKGGATDIKDALKEEAKQLIDDKIDEGKDMAKEKAQAEADKILADAKKESDKILADAKKLADEAKEAAYKEADKVEKSYKNILEKAGKKMAADAIRNTADKAHEKSMAKAQEKSDKILADAKAKSDAKINSIN